MKVLFTIALFIVLLYYVIVYVRFRKEGSYHFHRKKIQK